MAARQVRWRVGWSAVCLLSWGFCISLGLAESPTLRPVPSRGKSSGTSLAPREASLQQMKPLTPLEPAPIVDPDTSDIQDGCVVLPDGRVFRGAIKQLPQGYQLKSNTGTVAFTFDQVRTVATSLPQAYLQLRDALVAPTANDHLALGNWCSQNKLHDEASLEAQAALVLEPTRKEALMLLKKSEEAAGRVSNAAPAVNAVPARPIEAGGVLSAECQLEFTRHVNRIALNKCGNGACHGPASFSSFKLSRGSKSEPNLKMILKYIDPSDPEMSPLLVNARSAEGPHNGLFQGAKGREQYATIQAWVMQVSSDQANLAGVRRRAKPAPPREPGPLITIRPKRETPESPNVVASSESEGVTDTPEMELDNAPEVDISGNAPEIKTVAAEEEPPGSSPARPKRGAPLKSETIQKLLQSQDPDAFDPDEFNRMVHGDRPAPVE
jgi:hypothetical protein